MLLQKKYGQEGKKMGKKKPDQNGQEKLKWTARDFSDVVDKTRPEVKAAREIDNVPEFMWYETMEKPDAFEM